LKSQIADAVSSDINLHCNAFQRMKVMMGMNLINQINLFKSQKKEEIMDRLTITINIKPDNNNMDKWKREQIKLKH
jgi:hypothetical protein